MRIKIDRNKSEELFYEFKRLGLVLSMLGGVVQNPDFADTKDIEIFKEECEKLEKEYIRVKNEVIGLFNE